MRLVGGRGWQRVEPGPCLPQSRGALCLVCGALHSLGCYQTPSLLGSLLGLSQADLMPTPLGVSRPTSVS